VVAMFDLQWISHPRAASVRLGYRLTPRRAGSPLLVKPL
jgi:hypothetical protein